jgi:hypothetical protein
MPHRLPSTWRFEFEMVTRLFLCQKSRNSKRITGGFLHKVPKTNVSDNPSRHWITHVSARATVGGEHIDRYVDFLSIRSIAAYKTRNDRHFPNAPSDSGYALVATQARTHRRPPPVTSRSFPRFYNIFHFTDSRSRFLFISAVSVISLFLRFQLFTSPIYHHLKC